MSANKQHQDLLDMGYINNIPQPLWDGDWPVESIDVETGLYRIDVCGRLEVRHIGRCSTMTDMNGKKHCTGDFYTDPDSWEEREVAAKTESGAAGEAITKTAQVRMCGNSVCPPLSQALVAANYAEQQQTVRRAA